MVEGIALQPSLTSLPNGPLGLILGYLPPASITQLRQVLFHRISNLTYQPGNAELDKTRKAFLQLHKIVSGGQSNSKRVQEAFGKALGGAIADGFSIECADPDGNTLLLHAAPFVGLAKALCDKGASCEVKNTLGQTALHKAAAEGRTDKAVRFLVEEKRASLLVRDLKGATPLGLACAGGNLAAVRYFIDVKKIAIDRNGKLYCVNAASAGHLPVVRYLVEKKKAISPKAVDGAIQGGQFAVLRYLIDYSGRAFYEASLRRDTEDKAHYKACRDRVKHYRDSQSRTALHLAAYHGNLESVRYLVEEQKLDLEEEDNQGNRPLELAASEGRLPVVQFLAPKTVEADYFSVFPEESLKLAAANGHLAVVQWFVEQMVCKDYHLAALDSGASQGRLDVVRFLISKGAGEGKGWEFALEKAAACGHLNVVTHAVNQGVDKGPDSSFQKALLEAVSQGHLLVVRYLMSIEGATVSLDKGALLHIAAASKRRLEVAQYLLEEVGVKADVRDEQGRTPLHIAADKGCVEAARVLIEKGGADIHAKDAQKQTPLHAAAGGINCVEMAKYLVKEQGADVHARDDQGQTPLHKTIRCEAVQVAQFLVEEGGADLDARDDQERTALHLAAEHRSRAEGLLRRLVGEPLEEAPVGQKHCRLIFYLSEKGSNIDAVNRGGQTPLHKAAFAGRLNVVTYLVERGASLTLPDADGRTAYDCARLKSHQQVADYLLAAQQPQDQSDVSMSQGVKREGEASSDYPVKKQKEESVSSTHSSIN